MRDLPAIARSWLGTPFQPHACIRGAGVDCVHLCAAIYVEAGVLEQFDPPKYAIDGGAHADRSLIVEWLEASPDFLTVFQPPLQAWIPPRPESQIGDLLVFKFSREAWHVGLKLGGDLFIHSVRGRGVTAGTLGRFWLEKLTHIYRPVTLAVPY